MTSTATASTAPDSTVTTTAAIGTSPTIAYADAHQLNREWADAFNAGDMYRLLATYEPQAVLVPGPGAPEVAGHAAIKAALVPFLALGGRLRFTPRHWLVAGDIALASIAFEMDGGHDPDGNPIQLSGVTSEVLRRQPDGSWKYLIDHPFGGSH